MKRLVLVLPTGEEDLAFELWASDADEVVDGALKEIEDSGVVSYEKLEKVYNRYKEITGVDSKFELVSESDDEVVISWPDEDWTVRFVFRDV